MFPIKNGLKKGVALWSLLLNFALEDVIRRGLVSQGSWKLNGTFQLLVYIGDVKMLGKRVRTVKKNTETLVVACMEIGLEVCAGKTKYMAKSRDQNAGRSHKIKTDNSSFERVEEFKYLRTTLTNQNYIKKEIKSR